MARFDEKFVENINRPGRVGVLATADAQGQPNAAYFGSPRLSLEGELVMGLGANRSLANLEANPQAVFFVVQEAPVGFGTPGWRLYLKAKEIDRQGALLEQVRAAISAAAGEQAGRMIKAGVRFEVTQVRPLVDMG
ncbi:MAG: pyridoxamine 5'-phosphate oxidase family protein [Thermodesulfobacteriota bacterium]